jgi:Na+/proline symporter
VNSDGGGKVIQKQNSCKNEQHALLATLWYSLTNLAFRTWPWVLTALASMLNYPTIDDPEMAYPKLMMEILPFGMKGLMVASLLAAFMSTISTQLNWGASYLVHDFYRNSFVKGKSERHYIRASMVATFIVLICAGLAAWWTESVTDAFKFIIAFGSGTGPVYILRWFWWRINAWSEIAAMVSSFLLAIVFATLARQGHPVNGAVALLTSVGITTVVWVTTALLTEPTEHARLVSFYRLVRPAGPGWRHVQADAGVGPSADSLPQALLGWVLGIAFIYSALFGTGSFLYGRTSQALIFLGVFTVSGLWLLNLVPKLWGSRTE